MEGQTGWSAMVPPWAKMAQPSAQSTQDAYAAGFAEGQARFEAWVQQGGFNRLFAENCAVKMAMSGVIGGGGGLLLGAFLAPFDGANGLRAAETTTAKETAIATWHHTASKARSMGKTFAAIGAVYSLSECLVERYRARSDLNNSAYAGCLSGAFLARKAGGVGMAGGCAGFAAWSLAMESFMHSSAGESMFKTQEH